MQYHTPERFDDAVRIAEQSQGNTRFLAGGTDVLFQLRADIVTPDTLINIKGISGVKEITREADGGWRIGIAVSGAEMTEHPDLGSDWPGVVEATDLIGSTQIQGRCTMVGNLCVTLLQMRDQPIRRQVIGQDQTHRKGPGRDVGGEWLVNPLL